MTTASEPVTPDDLVSRTAMWCSLDIIAHDRRPIDDETAAILQRAARMIKSSVPMEIAEKLARGCEVGRCYPSHELGKQIEMATIIPRIGCSDTLLCEGDLQALARLDSALAAFAPYRQQIEQEEPSE